MNSRPAAEVAATSTVTFSAALWARAERKNHPRPVNFLLPRPSADEKKAADDTSTPTECTRNINLFRSSSLFVNRLSPILPPSGIVRLLILQSKVRIYFPAERTPAGLFPISKMEFRSPESCSESAG